MYWSSGNKVLLASDSCDSQLKRWLGGALIEIPHGRSMTEQDDRLGSTPLAASDMSRQC